MSSPAADSGNPNRAATSFSIVSGLFSAIETQRAVRNWLPVITEPRKWFGKAHNLSISTRASREKALANDYTHRLCLRTL